MIPAPLLSQESSSDKEPHGKSTFCLNVGVPIQIASDVHLEHERKQVQKIIGSEFITPKAPLLALLGDIGDPFSPIYEQFLNEQCEQFHRVVVVAGNHEFYDHEMEATRRKIAQVCQKNDKLIFLDHELGHDEYLYQCPETGGVVKLVGDTLWTNVPQRERYTISNHLNDYYYIQKGDKTLTINDTIQMHENFVNKLKTMAFDEACEYAICVLTHHAPYLENTVLEDEKPLETAMGTDLSYLFQKRSNITFWGFGHTHRNARISLPNEKSEGGKTILATNQLGYILKLGLEKIKYEQTKDGESAVATSQLGKEVENTDLPYSNDVVFRIPLLRTNTQCNSSKSIYHGE